MAEPISLVLGALISSGAILVGNQSVSDALTNMGLSLGAGLASETIAGQKSSRLEALKYWRKQCAKPENHAIEKAVYRAHLMACRLILEQKLAQDRHKSVWSAKTNPALEKLKVLFDKDINTTRKKNWRIPSENNQPHLFTVDAVEAALSASSAIENQLNTALAEMAITDVLRRFSKDWQEYSESVAQLLRDWLEEQFHDAEQGYMKALGFFIADEVKHGDEAFVRIFMAAETIAMRNDIAQLSQLVSQALTSTIDPGVLQQFQQDHRSILQSIKRLHIDVGAIKGDVGEIKDDVGAIKGDVKQILETVKPAGVAAQPLLLPLPLKRSARIFEPDIMQTLMADLTSNNAHLSRLCLRGVGGIGKSTLTEAIFHRLYEQGAFDHYLFVYADEGITTTLLALAEELRVDVAHPQWQQTLAIKLASVGPNMLVAIDNLQNHQLDDASTLLNLPGALIVSSREPIQGLTTQDYTGLVEEDCIALFEQHNPYESDKESIRLLIKLAARHTLAVELLAKQAAASMISARELYQAVKAKGFNLSAVYSESVLAQQGAGLRINEQIFRHFEILFDLRQLEPEETQLLGLIALLGTQPRPANYLKTVLELSNFTLLNNLVHAGWVQQSTPDQGIAFSVHPITQGVVLEKAFPDNNDTGKLLTNLQRLSMEAEKQGRYAEAETEFRALWAIQRRPEVLGEEHPNTLTTRHNIASQMGYQGRYAEAEKQFRALWAIERRPEVLGEAHPHTLTTRHNIAYQMGEQGRYADAEEEFRAVWVILRRPEVLGEGHPNTLSTRANIARQMGYQGRYAEAEEEFRAVWAIEHCPEVLGEAHPNTLTTRADIASQISYQGRYAEAEKEFRAVWAIQCRPEVLGDAHPNTLTTRANIALQMGYQGRYAEAEKEYRAVWAIWRRPEVLGEEHPSTLTTRANIAQQMSNQGRYAEAEEEYRAVWAVQRLPEVLGEKHPHTLYCQFCIARLLVEQCKYTDAKDIIARIDAPLRTIHLPFHKYIVQLDELIQRIATEEKKEEKEKKEKED